MKLTIAISFAFLLLFANANIDVTLANTNDQSYRLQVMNPIADPSGRQIRAHVTYKTTSTFSDENKSVGLVWTVAPGGSAFPDDAVSNSFVFNIDCDNPSGCTAAHNQYTSKIHSATFDGKYSFS